MGCAQMGRASPEVFLKKGWWQWGSAESLSFWGLLQTHEGFMDNHLGGLKRKDYSHLRFSYTHVKCAQALRLHGWFCPHLRCLALDFRYSSMALCGHGNPPCEKPRRASSSMGLTMVARTGILGEAWSDVPLWSHVTSRHDHHQHIISPAPGERPWPLRRACGGVPPPSVGDGVRQRLEPG